MADFKYRVRRCVGPDPLQSQWPVPGDGPGRHLKVGRLTRDRSAMRIAFAFFRPRPDGCSVASSGHLNGLMLQAQAIPLPGPNCIHLNFRELFVDSEVTPPLAKLQRVLANTQDRLEVVLNFEKCQWFELFALSQLLAIVLYPYARSVPLHVVGPNPKPLPYLKDYLTKLRARLAVTADADERLKIEDKIRRHSVERPSRRALAGAFLLGWGVFDALDEHYDQCYWYVSRDKAASLDELRRAYPFGYGSETASRATSSDRVMGFNVVYRDGHNESVTRINSEEIIAGPLRRFSSAPVIAEGALQNVLFFEPLENVFDHAYAAPSARDIGIFAMRLVTWMYGTDGTLTKQAQWLLKTLDPSYAAYIRGIGNRPFVEIVVADAGRGIPDSLREHVSTLAAGAQEPSPGLLPDWKVIQAAFDRYSTSRPGESLGFRGLSWVQGEIGKTDGLVQIVSNRGAFTWSKQNGAVVELGNSTEVRANSDGPSAWLQGTYVRIVVPLDASPALRPFDRRPAWPEPGTSRSLLTEPAEIKTWSLADRHGASDIDAVLDDMSGALETPAAFAAVDLGDSYPARQDLELLFRGLLARTRLHNRVLMLNAGRHVVCRLETVREAFRLRDAGVVVPVFETSLRAYWAGCTPQQTEALLKLLRGGTVTEDQCLVLGLSPKNPILLPTERGDLGLWFTTADVEASVRLSIGAALRDSLERRGAVNSGRFALPFSEMAVSKYVEPHQIFSDSALASRLCGHLATLLRWKYRRRMDPARHEPKVVTATRIGRDIAARMPEAYPESRFVYYDYHKVSPAKVRLHKHLANGQAVIVVDVVTTGGLVQGLLEACENADCSVLGVISLVDFSPNAADSTRRFTASSGAPIEHLTFHRSPAFVSPSTPTDVFVDPDTLSIQPTTRRSAPARTNPPESGGFALRFLDDAGALRSGHFEVFGHHFEFAVDMPALLTAASVFREEILRSVEAAILKTRPDETASAVVETAIVLYPDLGSAHLLHAALERRPKIQKLLGQDRLQFVEARHAFSSRERIYWLTDSETSRLREWAAGRFGDKYSVLVLDDGACSGGTLIALLQLAKLLKPYRAGSFVVVNRMSEIQIAHHQDIEKFVWAHSDFESFLHLNLPAFSRDNCPLCRERSDLLREHKSARTAWYVRHLEERLNRVDIQYSISSHRGDALPRHAVTSAFRWEQAKVFPAQSASYASRAAGASIALNTGWPVHSIVRGIAKADDELWRMVMVGLARRTDVQQAQRYEGELCRQVVRHCRSSRPARVQAALEALGQMRPEALLPYLDLLLTRITIDTEEVAAELTRLLRRVFSYRHFAEQETFEREIRAVKTLDAYALTHPSAKPLISGILFELGHDRKPIFDCATIVRKLEAILKTHRRVEHWFVYAISQYLSDQRTDVDDAVLGAVDEAIAIGMLGGMLSETLERSRRPAEPALGEASQLLGRAARDLSGLFGDHMKGGRIDRTRFTDSLDSIRELLTPVLQEIKRLYIDICADVRSEFAKWLESAGIPAVKIEVELDLPKTAVHVIVDRGLGLDILRNLFLNLSHSIDQTDGWLRAKFGVELSKDHVTMSLKCATPAAISERVDVDSTIDSLAAGAGLFGVERTVVERSPWQETWTFRRL